MGSKRYYKKGLINLADNVVYMYTHKYCFDSPLVIYYCSSIDAHIIWTFAPASKDNHMDTPLFAAIGYKDY